MDSNEAGDAMTKFVLGVIIIGLMVYIALNV